MIQHIIYKQDNFSANEYQLDKDRSAILLKFIALAHPTPKPPNSFRMCQSINFLIVWLLDDILVENLYGCVCNDMKKNSNSLGLILAALQSILSTTQQKSSDIFQFLHIRLLNSYFYVIHVPRVQIVKIISNGLFPNSILVHNALYIKILFNFFYKCKRK